MYMKEQEEQYTHKRIMAVVNKLIYELRLYSNVVSLSESDVVVIRRSVIEITKIILEMKPDILQDDLYSKVADIVFSILDFKRKNIGTDISTLN